MEVQWTVEELNTIFYALDNAPITGLKNSQTVLALGGKVQSAIKAINSPKVDAAVEKAATKKKPAKKADKK